MAKFLFTQRGYRKLLYNGYGYVKKRDNSEIIFWSCDKRKKCTATAKTAIDAEDGAEVEEIGRHTHPADPAKLHRVAAHNILKRKAIESTARAKDIISETLGETGVSLETAALPRMKSLTRRIRNYRRARASLESNRAANTIVLANDDNDDNDDPNQNETQKRKQLRFTDDQTNMIAEFYVDNFEVMARRATLPSVRLRLVRERQRLVGQLAVALNVKYRSRFTYEQINTKLQNLKRDARSKLRQMEETENPSATDATDAPSLQSFSEAVNIIATKMMHAGNGQEPTNNAMEEDAYQQSPQTATSPAVRVQSVRIQHRIRDSPTRRIAGTSSSFPVQNNSVGFDSTYSPQDDDYPVRDSPCKVQRLSTFSPNHNQGIHPMTSSILRLKKRALENKLALQEEQKALNAEKKALHAEKKAIMAKWSLAVDEFRRHVAEQRIAARGSQLTSIPIDVPPGLEQFVETL